MNLGNIKPQERISIEISCARLLEFEHHRVRICIPTVIGERYGDEHIEGALAPHETSATDPNAKYPFSVDIKLFGEITKGTLSCKSHPLKAIPIEGGVQFSLTKNGFLDRDFVLLAEGVAGNSLASYCTRGEETMIVASFASSISENNAALALKILVDCSGSMNSERITSAQEGLYQVINSLRSDDLASYSRFGSQVKRMTEGALPCSEAYLSELKNLVDNTYADLGGTEMKGALKDTFEIPVNEEFPPTVLLITDGDIWDVSGVIKAAKKSGHRIFAIGVGSAPNESLLRELAYATGGACELVTESEDIKAAIVRMFLRMRSSLTKHLSITWNQNITWQSNLPKYIFDGDTVHCLALTSNLNPNTVPVLNWESEEILHVAKANHLEKVENEALFRLGKFMQMQEAESEEEQKAIALKYQLLSKHTSLFLLIERMENDKIKGLVSTKHVPQMPAHNHGLSASSLLTRAASACCFEDGLPEVPCFIRYQTGDQVDACPPERTSCFSKITNLVKSKISPKVKTSSKVKEEAILKVNTKDLNFNDLKLTWNHELFQMKSVEACLEKIKTEPHLKFILELIEEMSKTSGLNEETICSLVMLCIFENSNQGESLDRHSSRVINHYLNNLDQDLVNDLKLKINAAIFKG